MRQVDEGAIATAVQAAEKETSGQIVCVLAKKSCDSLGPAALFAAACALLATMPLLAWTQLPAQRVFAIQALVFFVAFVLLEKTRLGVALISRRSQRRQAFRLAVEQFHLRGLSRARGGAGVLIYVSLAERYARVIADHGLDGKITEAEWREVIGAMGQRLRSREITEAFVEAVKSAGALLARAAPPDGGPNDLPDALVRLD